MSIGKALSETHLIEVDAIKRIWLYICKKNPNDSQEELEGVFSHALRMAIQKYMIEIAEEQVYEKVLNQLTKALFESPKSGLTHKQMLDSTLHTSCILLGDVSEDTHRACREWLADVCGNKRPDHRLSEVNPEKEKHVFATSPIQLAVRKYLLSEIEAVKEGISKEQSRKALVMRNQLYHLKESIERGLEKSSEETFVAELEYQRAESDFMHTGSAYIKHRAMKILKHYKTFRNNMVLSPDRALFIQTLTRARLGIKSASAQCGSWIRELETEKIMQTASLAFMLILSVHLVTEVNHKSSQVYSGLTLDKSPPVNERARVWKAMDIEDEKHFIELKKEKASQEHDQRYNPFPYTHVNWAGVRAYLKSYNSMLAESPYFEIVIDVGMEKNVDPRLLFSIVGQEQSFVRKGSVSSGRIINNPYNVYVSWQDYNTSLRDSTEIAANTIRNIMAEAPYEIHPVKALNEVYAEDPRWWIGVDYFYTEMVQLGEI